MILKDNTAVITGSSKGIGFEILKLFAENGCNIVGCFRSNSDDFSQKISEISKKNKVKIIPIQFDFMNDEEIIKSAKQIISLDLNIDILVNNAGAIENNIFQMVNIQKAKDIFQVNFFGTLLFTQYIVKKMMRKRSGTIINISSTSAFDPNKGRSIYSSSKSALKTAFEVISTELSPHIRINNIAPGLTNTKMMHNFTSQDSIDKYIQRLNIKRVAEASEIAKVALFLSSDSSYYINGQTIRVDGGLFN